MELTHQLVRSFLRDAGDFSPARATTRIDLTGLHLVRIQSQCLNQFRNIRQLLLGENGLTRMEGLHMLIRLNLLDLHGNLIDEIRGLEKCTRLHFLNLSDNLIRSVRGLQHLTELHTLLLSGNILRTADDLKRLGECPSITHLDLRGNKLCSLEVFDVVGQLVNLRVLLCANNAFEETPEELRSLIMFKCKSLVELDGVEISVKERWMNEVIRNGMRELQDVEDAWEESQAILLNPSAPSADSFGRSRSRNLTLARGVALFKRSVVRSSDSLAERFDLIHEANKQRFALKPPPHSPRSPRGDGRQLDLSKPPDCSPLPSARRSPNPQSRAQRNGVFSNHLHIPTGALNPIPPATPTVKTTTGSTSRPTPHPNINIACALTTPRDRPTPPRSDGGRYPQRPVLAGAVVHTIRKQLLGARRTRRGVLGNSKGRVLSALADSEELPAPFEVLVAEDCDFDTVTDNR